MRILDKNTGKLLDTVYLYLLCVDRFSLLPDLYEIFGREALADFLRVFAGTTITVPSIKDLEAVFRDVNIFLRVESGGASAAEQLADEYDLSTTRVNNVHLEVREKVRAMDLKFIKRKVRQWRREKSELP